MPTFGLLSSPSPSPALDIIASEETCKANRARTNCDRRATHRAHIMHQSRARIARQWWLHAPHSHKVHCPPSRASHDSPRTTRSGDRGTTAAPTPRDEADNPSPNSWRPPFSGHDKFHRQDSRRGSGQSRIFRINSPRRRRRTLQRHCQIPKLFARGCHVSL